MLHKNLAKIKSFLAKYLQLNNLWPLRLITKLPNVAKKSKQPPIISVQNSTKGQVVRKIDNQITAQATNKVEEPLTIIYDEIVKVNKTRQGQDSSLQNGTIPYSKAAQEFTAVKNSPAALQSMLNNLPNLPPALRAEAERLLEEYRKKSRLAAEGPENRPKKPPPRPTRF